MRAPFCKDWRPETIIPYDAEGLYYLGQALERTGDPAGARDAYQRCVEAVNTAPQHRRRLVSRWGKLAHSQLR